MWQLRAPLWGWAIASILLGLGFTFFSGATEAWLVDALKATGFTGHLEHVFGRAQSVGGAAMLVGTISGGLIAQATNLGVPYVLRAAVLGVTLLVALRFMRDIGFTPRRDVGPLTAVRTVIRGSIDGGLRNRPVRWMMLAAPFTAGTGFFVFYAAQPYLLQLYGDKTAYAVAGLAAAILAAVQIAGGLLVPQVRRFFRRRTTALVVGGVINVGLLALLGMTGNFYVALLLLAGWAFVFAIESPVRQAFMNGLIPSAERATVLSFDSLMGSSGGVVAQPALGRVADISGYGVSIVVSAAIQALAVPFVLLARRERAVSDPIRSRWGERRRRRAGAAARPSAARRGSGGRRRPPPCAAPSRSGQGPRRPPRRGRAAAGRPSPPTGRRRDGASSPVVPGPRDRSTAAPGT